MAGGPGVSAAVARARAGKYKTKRGGGRNYTRNLRPVGEDGVEKSMWASDNENGNDEEGSGSEESSEGEELADRAVRPVAVNDTTQEKSREQRKAEQKARKAAALAKKKGPVQPGDLPSSDEDEPSARATRTAKDEARREAGDESDDSLANDPMFANPNHTAAARDQAALGAPATAEEAELATKKAATAKTKAQKGGADPFANLSRREREAIQAEQAKARYLQLQKEGKTEGARADLERLKLVRAQREEAAAIKRAEEQEKKLIDEEKKAQMARMERQNAAAENKKKLKDKKAKK